MVPDWREVTVGGLGLSGWSGFHFSLLLALLFGLSISPALAQYIPERTLSPDPTILDLYEEVVDLAAIKAELILSAPTAGTELYPSHADPSSGIFERSGTSEWTSGFFPGILWMLYEATGEARWLTYARALTDPLKEEATRDRDHDQGFRILPSVGRGWALTRNREYQRILLDAAGTLAGRYHEQVGAIRSWDWFRTWPVIIDNMMNLELLLETGGWNPLFASYREIALKHAETTRTHHLRGDGSHVHIVDFFESGEVQWKGTIQGYGPESTWARGQAWGIYGFSMLYRFSERESDLESARSMAAWFLDHLPSGEVPFYDFEDPGIPHVSRDASAAAIAASGLLELYGHTGESRWLEGAERLLLALGRPEHLSRNRQEEVLLTRSTRWRGDPERGIIYGDYYFLEALLRYTQMAGEPLPELEREWPFALYAPYPNPARGEVTFDFALEKPTPVRLELFDVTGRRVARLIDNDVRNAGSHREQIDLSRFASGLYLVRLEADGQVISQKLILIR